MADKRITIGGALISIVVFLVGWAATDVLDNQTLFSPHEKVNDVVEIVVGNQDGSKEDLENFDVYKNQENLTICRITAASANVRSEAGKKSAIVTTANAGETFTATGNTEAVSGTIWYEILLENEKTGWISEKVCETEIIVNEKHEDVELNDNTVAESDNEQNAADNSNSSGEKSDAITFFSKYQMEGVLGDYAEQAGANIEKIPDDAIEKEMPSIIKEAKYSASYANPTYVGKKILHIAIALIILIIMFFIFVFIVFDHKFFGILLLAGMIAYIVIFWKDNTEYSYRIANKYELISAEYNNNCVLSFYDGDEVSNKTVDPTNAQVIVFPNDKGNKQYYVIKKKTKNIWYFLTESKPREREIHLIY